MKQLIALGLLLGWGSVSAAPVTWTLTNVELDFYGPSSFTGSFDYDADTNVYSNINIFWDYLDPDEDGYHYFSSTTEFYYYAETYESNESNAWLLSDYDWQEEWDVLWLPFASPLTNNGGEILLEPGGIYRVYENGYRLSEPRFTGISGSVTANVVPIPAAVWLFVSALAGLGWFRRKQTF